MGIFYHKKSIKVLQIKNSTLTLQAQNNRRNLTPRFGE